MYSNYKTHNYLYYLHNTQNAINLQYLLRQPCSLDKIETRINIVADASWLERELHTHRIRYMLLQNHTKFDFQSITDLYIVQYPTWVRWRFDVRHITPEILTNIMDRHEDELHQIDEILSGMRRHNALFVLKSSCKCYK